MAQSKYWCFTLNNFTDDDISSLLSHYPDKFSYIIFGKEIGEQGTPHLQGYLESVSRIRRTALSSLLGTRFHLERRKGTPAQAADYCRKDGLVTECGTISKGAGSRSDLDNISQRIRDGASLRDLWNEFPSQMIRYGRGIADAYVNLRPRIQIPIFDLTSFRWAPIDIKVHILWGLPGIGKTEFARALLPTALVVRHMDDLARYASGEYHGLIFDDMSFTHMPRTAQIHILDWELDSSIHIRYATATIPRHTQRIFTTNENNGAIFNLNDGAISRRVEIINLI